jgi:CBS domain-containing protein/copper chaperone CopZ
MASSCVAEGKHNPSVRTGAMRPECTRTVLLLRGMRGSSCRDRVAAALERVPGVTQVDVNLYRAAAVVAHDTGRNAQDLVAAIQSLGYDASIQDDRPCSRRCERDAKRSLIPEARTMRAVQSSSKATDIMTRDPVCVEPRTTIRELARLFEDNRFSGAPVVDERSTVVGVVSKSDIIRRCTSGDTAPPAYLFEVLFGGGNGPPGGPPAIPEPLVCVEDLMTADPLTVGPDVPLADVAKLMALHRLHRIVVVDQRRYPVGMITSLDLLAAFSS